MAGESGFIDVEIVGEDSQVKMMLAHLGVALAPPSMGMFLSASISPYLRRRAAQRFAQEGDDVSGPWAMLSQVTQDIREAEGFPPDHPINKRTGEMEQWVTGSPDSVTVSGIGATLTYPGSPPSGWLSEKVRTAQQGKQYPETVARPVLGINERDLLFVMAELAFYVQQGRFI